MLGDAGVDEDGVDGMKFLDRGGEASALGGPAGDVPGAEEEAGGGGQRGGGRRGGAVEDYDVVSEGVQEEGGGETDARGAASDEDRSVGVWGELGLRDGVGLGARHDGKGRVGEVNCSVK